MWSVLYRCSQTNKPPEKTGPVHPATLHQEPSSAPLTADAEGLANQGGAFQTLDARPRPRRLIKSASSIAVPGKREAAAQGRIRKGTEHTPAPAAPPNSGPRNQPARPITNQFRAGPKKNLTSRFGRGRDKN